MAERDDGEERTIPDEPTRDETDRDRAKPNTRTNLLALILGLVPWAIDWCFKVFVQPRPFWAFYFDPETIYFFDGMRLLSGQTPYNVDNPGTPIQIVSAILLTLTGPSPFDIDQFRLTGYVFVSLLKILAAIALVRTILRSLPLMSQVTALWIFLFCPSALEYDTVWSPETFIFPAGVLGSVMGWRYFENPSVRRVSLFGVAIGLCVAIKFTFLSWIAAMILAVWLGAAKNQRIGHTLSAIAGSILGFLFFTLPAAAKYPQMLAWLFRLGTRSGVYGAGEAGMPTLGELTRSIRRSFHFWPEWYAWIGGTCALLLIFLWIARKRGATLPRPELGLSIFAVAAITASYTLTARHFTPRYVIPAGVAAIVLFACAARRPQMRRSLALQALFMAIAGLFAARAIQLDITAHSARIGNVDDLRAKVRWVINQDARLDPVIVYSWRFPEPSFALRSLAYDQKVYREVETVFPNEGHYDAMLAELYLPAGRSAWDYFVVNRKDFARSPAHSGTPIAGIGEYLVIRSR